LAPTRQNEPAPLLCRRELAPRRKLTPTREVGAYGSFKKLASGVNVIILKIVSPKNGGKIALLTQNTDT
jgi:hypothetical protein